jgi:hypothetical protein
MSPSHTTPHANRAKVIGSGTAAGAPVSKLWVNYVNKPPALVSICLKI